MATNQRKKLEGISFTPQLKEILTKICEEGNDNDLKTMLDDANAASSMSQKIIPLRAINLAKSMIEDPAASATVTVTLQELNESLSNTKLVYTSMSTSTSTDNKSTKNSSEESAYAKRIKRLKLKEQERNYTKLTSNLDRTPDDDATLKSMMYAASIGANMIVAPLSIGVLMYFFSGKLFSFLFPGYQVKEGTLDIRGVIAGVTAGVIMLFIEMILFVIRNHEMDKFVTKKMKREKNPFGYNKKEAERTFLG